MPTKTIPCTPSEFQNILAALPKEGCALSNQTPTTGTVMDGGTVMTYSYDGNSFLTVVGVSKTSWLPTWSQIFSILESHFATI